MLIYKIQLPKGTDAKAFVTFMREEYIPAVDKDSTRIGKVSDLVLFQGDTTNITGQFFWHVNGVLKDPHVDAEVQSKFNSFGARLEFFGDYTEVAAWHE
jgi:hypothetical protein